MDAEEEGENIARALLERGANDGGGGESERRGRRGAVTSETRWAGLKRRGPTIIMFRPQWTFTLHFCFFNTIINFFFLNNLGKEITSKKKTPKK